MKKVLIVDDALTVLQLTYHTLTMEGYHVEKAINADEALEKLAAAPFDIGIFDVNMPGISGIELTRKVLSMPNGKDMKIIMLTTESTEEMKNRGRAAGATGWLTKPFKYDELTALVATLAGGDADRQGASLAEITGVL